MQNITITNMSEPENVATSSQSLVAAGMIPQPYKSLLIRHAQNVWKQQPVYQTVYEGSGFTPKFRCTVMVDGVSYTSPYTFQQRKTAEMDASRIAYFDLLQKLKNEALCLVREDKSLYKLILVEFAAKMNMQKPAYQTAYFNTLHVFSSSLVFGDVSCTGVSCRSKKEAEQSVARAVILKYIDSESGIKLSEIIKAKYKQNAKVMGSQSVHSNANAVVQHGTLNGHSNSLETGRTHAVSSPTLTSATPVPTVLAPVSLAGTLDGNYEVVQNGTVNGRINSLETGRAPEVSTPEVTSATPVPTVLAPVPLAGTLNGTNEVVQTRTVSGRIDSLEIGNIHEASTPALTPAITAPTVLAESLFAGTVNGTSEEVQPETVNGGGNRLKTELNQEVSVPALAPAILAPTVLAQTPFAGTHSIPTSPIISASSLGQVAIVPASHIYNSENSDTSPVIANPFSMSSPAVAQTNSVGSTSGKKPNCKTNVPTYTIIPAPSSGQVAIPVTNSSNVVQSENSEASPITVDPLAVLSPAASPMTVDPLPALSPAVAQTNDVGTTSSKKRSYKMKIKFQKKMRADIELPVAAIPVNQTPPFSAQ